MPGLIRLRNAIAAESLIKRATLKSGLREFQKPMKSQKEGQEDQGTLKRLESPPLIFYLSLVSLLALHWAPWNSLKLPEDEL